MLKSSRLHTLKKTAFENLTIFILLTDVTQPQKTA